MLTNQFKLFAASMAAFVVGSAAIAQGPVEGLVPTTALVNASSKAGVPLDPSLLTLQINGHPTPIVGVKPVGAGEAQIVILLDDGLRSSFALQLEDMSKFIMNLPPSTPVMLGFMRNGTVMSPTRGFTSDHKAVVDALRIPLASPGVAASPYFCLQELVNHWPSTKPGPRFVLMVTSGVDPYNGSTSILNQDSPYVKNAQEDAERAGVAVYSIYFGEAGYRVNRGTFSGQSYLQQVGESTGGQSLYMMDGNPVAFEPYLKEFTKDIAESYTISFMASSAREKDDTLDRMKLKTSQPGVKLHAPDAVHPGVSLQ